MARLSSLVAASLFAALTSISFMPPAASADTLNLYLLITSGHKYVDGDEAPPYPGTGPLAGYTQGQVNELVQRECAVEAQNAPPPPPPPKNKNAKSHPAPAAPPCAPGKMQATQALIASIQQRKAERTELDRVMYQLQVVSPPPPPLAPTVPPKPAYSDADRAAMCRISVYDYHRMANTLIAEVDAWKKGAKGIDVYNSSWIAASTDLYPEQAGLFAAQDAMLKDPHNTTGPQMRTIYEATWRKIIGMPDDSYCQQNHIQGIG